MKFDLLFRRPLLWGADPGGDACVKLGATHKKLAKSTTWVGLLSLLSTRDEVPERKIGRYLVGLEAGIPADVTAPGAASTPRKMEVRG
jgi:hypothetical protein